MAGLYEGGKEPAGSLKAITGPDGSSGRGTACLYRLVRRVVGSSPASDMGVVFVLVYNGWGDHRANHTIHPFWLDDRPPLLRHVDVRPAAGWSV
ncbi:hypothetical protein ANN_08048 [Periplaneta americana]|uniref:Uncharacterized protein n=1 Tax=Periplaneta americana TaxID=6978 RepID=A0ABQ8T0B2_PERAM|nr:hypothetical protein ANN_08048 [Periplaneta americana]